jgi:hypothetical protein
MVMRWSCKKKMKDTEKKTVDYYEVEKERREGL